MSVTRMVKGQPVGKTQEVIAEMAAGRSAKLIVKGSYGETGIRKLLMGRTAGKVIGLAGYPVLTVTSHRDERMNKTAKGMELSP